MRVITSKAEMKTFACQMRAAGRSIGLVPTMGALHEGHLSLVRLAKRQCDTVVVSIFVNPTQFGPREDFSRYPRDLKTDLDLLSQFNLDVTFAPSAKEMYPEGFGTYVKPGDTAARFEGKIRTGHFRGVATVVLKLFNIVNPDLAYFGQKDFQQVVVIRQMVDDLDLDVRLVVSPTVRDADGLALSSRNAYLTPEEHQAALVLPRSLRRAQELVHSGEMATGVILAEITKSFDEQPQVKLDYLAIVEARTMRMVERVSRGCIVLVAAKVGKTRLIDNLLLGPPSTSPEELLQGALAPMPKVDLHARIPGLETEILRQKIENCRDCAAIPSIVLPPRQFLTKYLKARCDDLNTIEVAVVGRHSPLHSDNYLYTNPARRSAFASGLFQLLGVQDFDQFTRRFVLTDAIRCHCTHVRIPDRALENCARHLQAELKLFPRLKFIVVLGADAYALFQKLLGNLDPKQSIPFNERVREQGWACEDVKFSWLSDQPLRIFYCHHPAVGYLHSPSIGDRLR